MFALNHMFCMLFLCLIVDTYRAKEKAGATNQKRRHPEAVEVGEGWRNRQVREPARVHLLI